MKIKTLEHLRLLHGKYKAGVFGKIAQKLLALSFVESGWPHVTEHSVQGVDILAARGGLRFAFEVKTTEKFKFSLDPGNLNALREYEHDSYLPAIAVLQIGALQDWLLARVNLADVCSGSYSIDHFRGARLVDLEREIRPKFDRVVEEHFADTLRGGEDYLTLILRHTDV